jgi:hypothetical protein
MRMIATTIRSSISENPDCFCMARMKSPFHSVAGKRRGIAFY